MLLPSRMAGRTLGLRGPDLARGPEVARLCITLSITVAFNKLFHVFIGKVETVFLQSIFYMDRKTNIWVRARTKVIDLDIISNVRKMKWSWAGHINRLKDDRWTLHVTTWRPSQTRKDDKGEQPSERRPGQILERQPTLSGRGQHTRQANLETAC